MPAFCAVHIWEPEKLGILVSSAATSARMTSVCHAIFRLANLKQQAHSGRAMHAVRDPSALTYIRKRRRHIGGTRRTVAPERRTKTVMWVALLRTLYALTLIALPLVVDTQASSPKIALSITTPDTTIESDKVSMFFLSVKERNNSDLSIKTVKESGDESRWYRVEISRDGGIVEKIEPPKQDKGSSLRKVARGNGPFSISIPPHKSVVIPFAVTTIYDMSKPGTYFITLEKQTDPGKPDNEIVRSNTVAVTVLAAAKAGPRAQ